MLKTTNYVDIIFKNPTGESTQPTSRPEMVPGSQPRGTKTEKEIAEALSKNTTLSRGEAVLVLDELQAVIQNALLDGYSVQMGDWGSFHLTFNCTGTDTEAECTADKITSVNIRFRPGKQMKEALAKATFVAR